MKMEIKNRIKEILYNDIQEELELRIDMTDIEEINGLIFMDIRINDTITKEEDENQLELVKTGLNISKEMREFMKSKSEELTPIMKGLEEEGVSDYRLDKEINKLIESLHSQSFEIEWLEITEDIIHTGDGKTLVQVEYFTEGGYILIDNYDIEFEYEINGNDEYMKIKSITLSENPPD